MILLSDKIHGDIFFSQSLSMDTITATNMAMGTTMDISDITMGIYMDMDTSMDIDMDIDMDMDMDMDMDTHMATARVRWKAKMF